MRVNWFKFITENSLRALNHDTTSWCKYSFLLGIAQKLWSENTNLRGSAIFWLTSCLFCLDLAALLMLNLLVWSNPNQSNRRSAIQWYSPLWWVFSALVSVGWPLQTESSRILLWLINISTNQRPPYTQTGLQYIIPPFLIRLIT